MACITPNDIKAIQPTTLPDALIQKMINSISKAEQCLIDAGADKSTIDLLITYGAAHQVALASPEGGAQVKQQRGQSGASRSFAVKDSNGIESTQWGRLINQMDQWGCIKGLLNNNEGWLYTASIGPDNYEH